MDITNKTRQPLSLALPGGKKLFLGPGKTGQIAPKTLEQPLFVKLLEAGDIETTADRSKNKGVSGGKAGSYSGSSHKGTGLMRKSGAR